MLLAKELLTKDIPTLKPSDTGLKALEQMDKHKVSHLPVLNKGTFLGLISDAEVIDFNILNEPIGNRKIPLLRTFVSYHQHIYEVFALFSTFNLSVIPVLDEQQLYLGVITLPDLMRNFMTITSMKEPGGLLVLEIDNRDYHLSEIARIVESNDAKILSLYISSSDSGKIEVTLKINRIDLTSILQTFYRYNYIVKASFHQSEFTDDMIKRYEAFINYLNV